jgi:hypothetical protein
LKDIIEDGEGGGGSLEGDETPVAGSKSDVHGSPVGGFVVEDARGVGQEIKLLL